MAVHFSHFLNGLVNTAGSFAVVSIFVIVEAPFVVVTPFITFLIIFLNAVIFLVRFCLLNSVNHANSLFFAICEDHTSQAVSNHAVKPSLVVCNLPKRRLILFSNTVDDAYILGQLNFPSLVKSSLNFLICALTSS